MLWMQQCLGRSAIGAAVVLCGAISAHADVKISDKATQNMSCSGGVCSPTAKDAILNATDLANMLAGGDVTVNTGGTLAKDIDISAALSWASTSRLTLDAYRSLTVKKPMSVTGTGALTIATSDGGKDGEFVIDEKASIQFWDLNSSLIINRNTYTLVGDIKTLASDIAANPAGFYALAKPYDASGDGTYEASPIQTSFSGIFNGLGNAISNFRMRFSAGASSSFGFFANVGQRALIRNIGLAMVDIGGVGYPAVVGALAGDTNGTIESCWATGAIAKPSALNAIGGLVGENSGTVTSSFAAIKLETQTSGGDAGGLVGANYNSVSRSYAKGSVRILKSSSISAGGVAGSNAGRIENVYSLASVRDGRGNSEANFGGLVGENDAGAKIASTYAAGKISESGTVQGTEVGGLVGFDGAQPGSISSAYWDLEKGISDPSQGAGNIKNDPGITGVTTQQLQSGLPQGFDPKVWTQDPDRNQGFPYLRGLPSS